MKVNNPTELSQCEQLARFSTAPHNLERMEIPSEINPGMALRAQHRKHSQKFTTASSNFLGRLHSFRGIDVLRHPKPWVRDSLRGLYTFMPLNSLSLDLLMRFPIPGDDMLIHSSFSWSWIVCRNFPLLFVDTLFSFLFFSAGFSLMEQELWPYSLECSRSVLNKGSNCFEILTWDTHCFTLLKWLLDHSSQHLMLTKPFRATKRCHWNFCSHKQALCFSPQTRYKPMS